MEITGGQISTQINGKTGNPSIYAVGDCAHGPDLISTALAAGQRAAKTALKQPSIRTTNQGIAPASGLNGSGRAVEIEA